jgi:hypothetical protein
VVGRIFKVNAAPVGSPWMWDFSFRAPQGSIAHARLC